MLAVSEHTIAALAENCRAQASAVRFECNALDRTGGLYNESEAGHGRAQAAMLDEAADRLDNLEARVSAAEADRFRYAVVLGRMYHLATGAEDGTPIDPDVALDALTKLRRHNVQMFRALERISLIVDPTGESHQSIDKIVHSLRTLLGR